MTIADDERRGWMALAAAHRGPAPPLPPTDDRAREIAREQCGGAEPDPETYFAALARLRSADCAE